MKLQEHDRPRAHLVVDDFFDAKALTTVMAEVAALERTKKLKPGLVRDIGHDGQSVFFPHERRQNRATWIHEGSRTLRAFRERLWSAPFVSGFERAREPLFQIIPNCWAPHLQVSSYLTGDHYDFHEDEGAGVNLTAIVFLARDPEKIHGGDIVFSYGDEQATVKFRHNRLLVFPSKTLHRVTKVRVASDDPLDARVSLQCWLAHGKAPAEAERREAVADEPTFLLADEPIIAAAQALVASPESPEQTPESLYWGAFYLSRILTSNLAFLVAAHKKTLGPVRIHQREDRLEVFGMVERARVGFALGGAEVSPSEALTLFVERKRTREERPLFPGTGEAEATALLGRLLASR